jgi:hypothetical protein
VYTEGGMKMEIETLPKYRYVFEDVPPIWRSFELQGDKLLVRLAFGLEIPISNTDLQPAEFRQFFYSLKVHDGKKRMRWNKIILDPKKTSDLHVRIPRPALEVIKKAAEINGKTLTGYCLETILGRAVKEMGEYSLATRNPGGTRGS